MRYSLIITTYQHLEDCLIPCIESIKKYTDLTDAEVIISANGCKDGTKAYVESLGEPFKLIWNDEAIGFSRAMNAGIEVAKGDYVILLNNDIVLLNQNKDTWINMLLEPFKDNKVGITGPILAMSPPAGRNFIIFFCTAIKREVINKVGLLDTIFGTGGGEDTDYCIKAENLGYTLVQVPQGATALNDKYVIGGFPIYHKGEATVHDKNCVSNWDEIFAKNSNILSERYNLKWKLCNNFERAVIGKDDDVPPREDTRYKWARQNIVGSRILEIGCSSGYGIKYFKDIKGLEYLGIDKDKPIVEFAEKNFGAENIHFTVDDVVERFKGGKSGFEFWDTIIAFEVIEHIDNGIEMAQILKQHCKCLLITTPYKEVPGLWGCHHKLHQLDEKHFPGFQIKYIKEEGGVADTADKFDGRNLLLMKWQEKEEVLESGVTAVVSTKDRYFTSLPNCLTSIALQTVKPKYLIIYDDGEHKDLREDPIYQNIFSLLSLNGIAWEMKFGEGLGQVKNHQRSISDAKTEWIWRIDDDTVMEATVLEKLMRRIAPDVGAIGGLVLDPKIPIYESALASNKIENIYLGMNVQWFRKCNIGEVDHLYSSFIYRKKAAGHGYCMELSRVGHREETIFTYEMKRAGWKLIVEPTAVTWHLRNPKGGIRSDSDKSMWERDEGVFFKKMSQWKVHPKKVKLCVLDSGLGDHLVFKAILPDLKKKYGEIILANCYPEVFIGEENVRLISIAEAQMVANLEGYQIYKFLWDNTDKRWTLEQAYREMYGVANVAKVERAKKIIISPFSRPLRNGKENPKNYPYWPRLIRMLKEKDFQVIQIGRKGEKRFEGVDDMKYDLPLKDLRALLDSCSTWIAVDNFWPHFCHLHNRPGIVLFGQSDPEILGHPENINLLKDGAYLREKQFDIWECAEYIQEAFVLPSQVMDTLTQGELSREYNLCHSGGT